MEKRSNVECDPVGSTPLFQIDKTNLTQIEITFNVQEMLSGNRAIVSGASNVIKQMTAKIPPKWLKGR